MGLLKPLTSAQRTKIKLAKLNKSTGKSAISEAGRTIRSVAGQITAIKTAKAYNESKYQDYLNKKQSAAENTANIENALKLYNQLIEGNADASGKSGNSSTTEVGGAGSKLGG